MAMDGNDSTFHESVELLCAHLLETLETFEAIQREYDPGTMSTLRERLEPFTERLDAVRTMFRSLEAPSGGEELRNQLVTAADLTVAGLHLFNEQADIQRSFTNVMRARRKINQAQEALYPLRRSLPPVNRFFLEVPVRPMVDHHDPVAPPGLEVGISHIGMSDHPYARGSFSLYVPESYDGVEARPLVVALHGGWGHGRDFLWSWFREARSRQFLLLSPTSHQTTWSITGPDIDGKALDETLSYVIQRWNVDRNRILLTGISDGATYALTKSLHENSPFTAFAPVSGVLPPFDLRHVGNKRIFWVHGALDWMFPVQRAQQGYAILKRAGADVTLRVIHDLSHTYPREQNDHILTWFDPALALPVPQGAYPAS